MNVLILCIRMTYVFVRKYINKDIFSYRYMSFDRGKKELPLGTRFKFELAKDGRKSSLMKRTYPDH